MENIVWPACGGETAALVRQVDWAATPLGPIGSWPQRLRTLVDLVLRNPVPCALVWGPSGNLIYNDGYAAICGDKHPRVLGGTLRDAWPEAWDFNSAMLESCLGGRAEVFEKAHFLLERDGQVRDSWFNLHYVPVLAEDGRAEGVLATVFEITAQVLAEQAGEAHRQELRRLNSELDAQRARLEAANRQLAGDMDFLNELFQRSPSFIAVLLGPDHRFELTNAAYDRLIRQRGQRGTPLREALPEIADQGFIELLDSVYRSGEPYQAQKAHVMLDRDDGLGMELRVLDFIFQPLKNAQGRTHGIFVEGIDVTAHAMAEERLRVAQEAGEVGTFEWWPECGELSVSGSYRRLFGLDADARVTTELILGLVDPAYHEVSGAARIGRCANPLEYAEYPILRADTGERRWVARKGQAVDADAGKAPRYLGVVYDITELKQAEHALRESDGRLRELNETLERTVSKEVAERVKAENALRQAQKMEAVGQLASGVAHDFNNVLQIISSNLQLMELDARAGPLLRSRLEHAIAAVERGSRLSFQLLAFARRQPLQPVVTHLGTLLHNIEHLMQRALGDTVALVLEADADLWHVAVDPNQMENAIINMAINARDAMPGGGQFTVRLRNRADGPRGAGVALSVADTGCGMPPDVLAKVFDPFYTTKEPGKGTGLGMSMVYGFVKQSGGEIRIDSAAGAGTTITIELPRAEGVAVSVADARRPQLVGGDETILVVEDDLAVRAAVADVLSGLGYRVLAAANGEQALAIVQSGTPVDLMFTDVSMPGSVDSTELVTRAAMLAPEMGMLLASGHALDRSLLDARMPAGLELLPKPYSVAQLAGAVRQELQRPRRGACVEPPVPQQDSMRFLVVEDDHDARELACEMLAALGHRTHGVGSAEQALDLLATASFDVLFTDLNLPGIAGDELASRAARLAPGLDVIVASGEGVVPVAAPGCELVMLPKPYDLIQLQQGITAIERAKRRTRPESAVT